MSRIIPLYDNRDGLAIVIGLPKITKHVFDWYALPWKVLMSWFKWEDDIQRKRLYFVYTPPIDDYLVEYLYLGSTFYDYRLKMQRGYSGKDLEVTGFIRQCSLGVFMGKRGYIEKIISPKNGFFVNLIDMQRFEKEPHYVRLEPGEAPFYIDYSFHSPYSTFNDEELDKLRDLKRIKSEGEIAGEMLRYLLNKYGISEKDL